MRNILILIATAIIMTLPNITFGQKSDVYKELESAVDYGKKAKEYSNLALDYIKKKLSANYN